MNYRTSFFDNFCREAFILDDITLGTNYADFGPEDVFLRTRFSRNVLLNIPIVSAAMDTVTEARLAMELARAGGIGIIHRNLSPVTQAEEVERVKYANINGRINNPVTVFADELVGDVLKRREEKRYSFHSFLVVSRRSKKLVGVFTRQDLDFCETHNVKVKDIMTRRPIVAPLTTNAEDAYAIMRRHKVKLLPLVDDEKRVAALFILKDVKRVITHDILPDNVGPDGRLRVAAAIGIIAKNTDTEKRVELLVDKNVDVLVIDMGHGDSRAVVETIKWLKQHYPAVDVVAGNISLDDSAKRLFEADADGVRVGQGPGSTCTTGLITGTGVPLATAIDECASVAERYGLPIGADGGFRYPGDIVKALALGSSYAVLGSIFAGTDEAPGKVIPWEGGLWKDYRGMGSLGAMIERVGSRERYVQSDTSEDEFVPEGIEGRVPYAGPLSKVIARLVGGIRKGMFNAGAKTITELQEKAIVFCMTSAGYKQAHPRIIITKQAPNYNVVR